LPVGEWEPVHAFIAWDNGPRQGIANFGGQPHVYESDFTDQKREKEATFYLMPIPAAELGQVLEVMADQREHPHFGTPLGDELTRGTKYSDLMSDGSILTPLWGSLLQRLRQDRSRWAHRAGEFRPRGYTDEDLAEFEDCHVPLEVRWSLPTGT
jgi:hypothetical protein